MTLRQRAYMLSITLMLAFGTFGCASTPPVNVIGGCPVPAQYDVIKTTDHLTKVDPKGHAAEEASERHKHHMDDDDYNAFVAYVKENCQH